MDVQKTPPPKVHIVTKRVVSGGEPFPLNEVAVLLHPGDDVAIARLPLGRGAVLRLPPSPGPVQTESDERLIEVTQRIPSGHKVALRDIAAGQPVLRYGSVIGFATQRIAAEIGRASCR